MLSRCRGEEIHKGSRNAYKDVIYTVKHVTFFFVSFPEMILHFHLIVEFVFKLK